MAALDGRLILGGRVGLAIGTREKGSRRRARMLAEDGDAQVVLGGAEGVDRGAPKLSVVGAEGVICLGLT